MQEPPKALEWNGEAYHRLSDMQYSVGMQLVESLPLQGNETVLDAGCGSGRITQSLLNRLPHGKVIGVDLGESMLHTARKMVRIRPGQNVKFIQADLQTFVSDEHVDGIYSNMCLHFVHDHATLFQNMASSLKPNGWLALQFVSSQQADLIRPWFDFMRNEKFRPYLHSVVYDFKGADVPSTIENLSHAGFVGADVRAIEMQQVPEYQEKMREYFATVMLKDCLDRLPENLRDEFRNRVEKLFNSVFDQPFTFLRVRAHLGPVQ